MKKLVSVLLAALLLAGCGATPAPTEPPETVPTEPPVMVDPVSDNYRTFYQVFVGSFSDSNNDGIGDLRGVINRLDDSRQRAVLLAYYVNCRRGGMRKGWEDVAMELGYSIRRVHDLRAQALEAVESLH